MRFYFQTKLVFSFLHVSDNNFKFKRINDWFCKFAIFVVGLLGNFDGNVTNDFKAPNGVITASDSVESVIYDYGKLCMFLFPLQLYNFINQYDVLIYSINVICN